MSFYSVWYATPRRKGIRLILVTLVFYPLAVLQPLIMLPTASATQAPTIAPVYTDRLQGYMCIPVPSGYTMQGTGRTAEECIALCDATPGCVAWLLHQSSTSCVADTAALCVSFTICTGIGTSACSAGGWRATQVTPQWRVGCGSVSPCCTAVGQCMRTMNYPSNYNNNAFCLASFQMGSMDATGATESGHDVLVLMEGGTAEQRSGGISFNGRAVTQG
eukprot:Hpha_TRINITY_DN16970_c3_g1::TRINITY_DN16970_c3_g1_i7::g.52882::m.52882